MDPSVEDVDLAAVTAALRRVFESSPPREYLPGRTALRDAVADHLGCSAALAEEIVDTMIGRGFLRFEGDPEQVLADEALWIIGG